LNEVSPLQQGVAAIASETDDAFLGGKSKPAACGASESLTFLEWNPTLFQMLLGTIIKGAPRGQETEEA
jgi:hypothetical protein